MKKGSRNQRGVSQTVEYIFNFIPFTFDKTVLLELSKRILSFCLWQLMCSLSAPLLYFLDSTRWPWKAEWLAEKISIELMAVSLLTQGNIGLERCS